MRNDFENINGTWAFTLKKNWDQFNDVLDMIKDSEEFDANWRAFNRVIDELNDLGPNAKIDRKAYRLKFRDYLLYDMYRRHEEEMKKE